MKMRQLSSDSETKLFTESLCPEQQQQLQQHNKQISNGKNEKNESNEISGTTVIANVIHCVDIQ